MNRSLSIRVVASSPDRYRGSKIAWRGVVYEAKGRIAKISSQGTFFMMKLAGKLVSSVKRGDELTVVGVVTGKVEKIPQYTDAGIIYFLAPVIQPEHLLK